MLHRLALLTAAATVVNASLIDINLCSRDTSKDAGSLIDIKLCSPKSPRSVIIQMFQWSWDTIAAECTNFIGPAGYGFVQVSPPSEHIMGSQWWTDYQPVSYILTSKRGDRNQFKNMIDTCRNAGVGVIADTIFNHMTGFENGTGVAGSPFTHYNYPGIYQIKNFHQCGLTPNNDISDYTNRTEIQTCELVNLADLATGTEYVRGRLATYANDLLSLGVVGLRLDAAKHIATEDIANILRRLKSKPYITQEVIFGVGEPVQPSEYARNGDVQEFRYTTAVKNAFQGDGISSLKDLNNRGWIPSDGANVFIANHDTERNGASLSYKTGVLYRLAHVFMLAHPYGTPTVLSSYSFADHDTGSPSSGAGSCSDAGGSNGWICQHRWTAIAGMVQWRNGVTGGINHWVSGTQQQIAFGRGASGFVAINNEGVAWTMTFKTNLPDNSYCDMVSGVAGAEGTCTGASYIISRKKLTAKIPPRSAIALFTGAVGTGSNGGDGVSPVVDIPVSFRASVETNTDENLFVVGSIPQLGNWAPSNAIAMSSSSLPTWNVNVTILAETEFYYKYIRKTSNGSVIWESDPNRSAVTPPSGSLTLDDTWR